MIGTLSATAYRSAGLRGGLFDDALAQAGHIAVAENALDALDKTVLGTVAFNVLAGQEPHDRLADR